MYIRLFNQYNRSSVCIVGCTGNSVKLINIFAVYYELDCMCFVCSWSFGVLMWELFSLGMFDEYTVFF